MTVNETENPALQALLTRMFDMVGADKDKLDVKTDRWYTKHTWTPEQEAEFADWFVAEGYKLPKMDTVFSHYALRNKPNRKKAISEFLFLYGWSYVPGSDAPALPPSKKSKPRKATWHRRCPG